MVWCSRITRLIWGVFRSKRRSNMPNSRLQTLSVVCVRGSRPHLAFPPSPPATCPTDIRPHPRTCPRKRTPFCFLPVHRISIRLCSLLLRARLALLFRNPTILLPRQNLGLAALPFLAVGHLYRLLPLLTRDSLSSPNPSHFRHLGRVVKYHFRKPLPQGNASRRSLERAPLLQPRSMPPPSPHPSTDPGCSPLLPSLRAPFGSCKRYRLLPRRPTRYRRQALRNLGPNRVLCLLRSLRR